MTDWSQLARLRRIGIVPGRPFEPSTLSQQVLAALETVPAEGLAHLRELVPTMARVSNGWGMNTDTVGVYGNFYAKRAAVTLVGLGANQPEDAIYPLQQVDADGRPATGADSYVLHMDADQLPPVDAFWSVTMYDEEGYQIANPIDRFALGDRDPLQYNDDGSLDVWVQTDPQPGKGSELVTRTQGPTVSVPAALRSETRSPRWPVDTARPAEEGLNRHPRRAGPSHPLVRRRDAGRG